MIFTQMQMDDMARLARRLLDGITAGTPPREALSAFYVEHTGCTEKDGIRHALSVRSICRVGKDFQKMIQPAQGDLLRFCQAHDYQPRRKGSRDDCNYWLRLDAVVTLSSSATGGDRREEVLQTLERELKVPWVGSRRGLDRELADRLEQRALLSIQNSGTLFPVLSGLAPTLRTLSSRHTGGKMLLDAESEFPPLALTTRMLEDMQPTYISHERHVGHLWAVPELLRVLEQTGRGERSVEEGAGAVRYIGQVLLVNTIMWLYVDGVEVAKTLDMLDKAPFFLNQTLEMMSCAAQAAESLLESGNWEYAPMWADLEQAARGAELLAEYAQAHIIPQIVEQSRLHLDQLLSVAGETWIPNLRRDKIQGCLIGGAVGDALGYPVEFLSWQGIQTRYGRDGIQSYDLDPETDYALISDDTQMTLFTANGLLIRDTRGHLRGIAGPACRYVHDAYRDWLMTQTSQSRGEDGCSWLLDIPKLYSCRAPGGTCLSALGSKQCGTIDDPINDSKGCGGIMRVAPVGLFYDPNVPDQSRADIDRMGAEVAAITHGHSLGYIPAAVLAHIVNVAVYGGCPLGDTLLDAVEDAMDTVEQLFGADPHWGELRALMDKAEELAGNAAPDADNIHALGGGWVAEETLAISVYCALRYPNDFSRGVIAAVNHSGDSDSTGAVTGNILGAWLGCKAIAETWKRNLELRDIIFEMADDLSDGCPLTGYDRNSDPPWVEKYVEGRYYV